MATSIDRINEVAQCLWGEIYEEEFGGKPRGKFLLTREDLKSLLGVQRLHFSTVRQLTDACLKLGLVVIDLDSYFAMVELRFLEKWRRVPKRLIKDHTQELDAFEGEDEDEEDLEDLEGMDEIDEK
jgi:hypothetical protein